MLNHVVTCKVDPEVDYAVTCQDDSKVDSVVTCKVDCVAQVTAEKIRTWEHLDEDRRSRASSPEPVRPRCLSLSLPLSLSLSLSPSLSLALSVDLSLAPSLSFSLALALSLSLSLCLSLFLSLSLRVFVGALRPTVGNTVGMSTPFSVRMNIGSAALRGTSPMQAQPE